jgi:hypothetical protein
MAVGLELPLHLMANACMLQELKMFLFASTQWMAKKNGA